MHPNTMWSSDPNCTNPATSHYDEPALLGILSHGPAFAPNQPSTMIQAAFPARSTTNSRQNTCSIGVSTSSDSAQPPMDDTVDKMCLDPGSPSRLPAQQRDRQVKKLEQEKQDLLQQILYSSASAQSLSVLLSKKHNEADQLLKSVETHEQRIAELQALLDQREKEALVYTEQLASKTEDLGTLKLSMSEQTIQYQKVLDLLEAERNANHALRTDLETAQRAASAATRSEHDLRNELAQQRLEVQKLAAQLSEAENGAGALTDELNVLAKAHQSLVSALARVVDRLSSSDSFGVSRTIPDAPGPPAQHDWASSDPAQSVRVAVQYAQRVVDALDSHLVQVQERFDAADDLIRRLESRVDTAEADAARSAQALEGVQRDLARTTNDQQSLLATKETLQKDHDAAVAALSAQLQAVRMDADAAARDRDAARAQAASAAQDAEAACARVSRVTADLAACKRLVEAERRTRRDREKTAVEYAEMQMHIQRLTAELDAERAAVAEEQAKRRAETAHWMQATVDLQHEHAGLKDEYTRLAAAHAALQEQTCAAKELRALWTQATLAEWGGGGVPSVIQRPSSPMASLTGATLSGRLASGAATRLTTVSPSKSPEPAEDSLLSTLARLRSRSRLRQQAQPQLAGGTADMRTASPSTRGPSGAGPVI
ncbi:hypothetical protein AMAG_13817 [Allomyces macrogynus ATCC 38327]|uniref:Uncharacterized protein n=1 Tax=Allomyces macrogynus (strain ATCC 38327) TaxID=578462 RepID=A0A0L0T2W4_ALLM3|nr:hypothetical protein AMAG_13817 [Allomyces macrogynus ATCC 38327]|eukprot:KNE68944.1 hypothetical protein AMAG_13817 [Allomyces macrogynus ATCC 38327]